MQYTGVGVMRRCFSSLSAIFLVLGSVVALTWAATMTAVVQLLASTVMIMGGTGHPLVNPSTGELAEPGLVTETGHPAGYVAATLNRYFADGSDDKVALVWTPEQFFPVDGTMTFDKSVAEGAANLERCVRGPTDCTRYEYDGGAAGDVAVFGFSQSGRVATVAKRALLADPGAPDVTFVLIGNPNRADGGILQRFKGLYIPLLGVTFDGATPTDSCDETECRYPTADISRQFDGWSDFPNYPLNLVSTLNAVAGILVVHGAYFDPADPVLWQGQQGDTNYYMIPTQRLPLLEPLALLGVPAPILAVLDAPLRVIVEWGYDREGVPGTPTRAKLLRLENPITDLVNLVRAVGTGLDDGISMALNDPDARPFKTTPASSPFGVGGRADLPQVTAPTAPKTPNDPPEFVPPPAPVSAFGLRAAENPEPAGELADVDNREQHPKRVPFSPLGRWRDGVLPGLPDQDLAKKDFPKLEKKQFQQDPDPEGVDVNTPVEQKQPGRKGGPFGERRGFRPFEVPVKSDGDVPGAAESADAPSPKKRWGGPFGPRPRVKAERSEAA